jgi:hypothetical protein
MRVLPSEIHLRVRLVLLDKAHYRSMAYLVLSIAEGFTWYAPV